MNSALEKKTIKPARPADARLDNLLLVLKRARTVLYTAMMDGTVKNTLWANADENLLDYLDRKIATALEEVSDSDGTEPAGLEASLWGLLTRPCVLDHLAFSKNERKSSNK